MLDSTLYYAIGLRGKDSSSRMGLKFSFLTNKREVAKDKDYSYAKGFCRAEDDDCSLKHGEIQEANVRLLRTKR
jgi:hypothetical protein